MSVAYWDAQGEHFSLQDEEDQKFSYHVSAQSGALVIMQKLGNDPWHVYRDFSPNGWREAAGTRFNNYPSDAAGLDGKVTFGGTGKLHSF